MVLRWDRVTRPDQPSQYREHGGKWWIEKFEGRGLPSFWVVKYGGRVMGYAPTLPKAKQDAQKYAKTVRPAEELSVAVA